MLEILIYGGVGFVLGGFFWVPVVNKVKSWWGS